MNDFVDEFALDGFPHIADESGDIWAHYGIIAQPAWVFVNDDGSIESHVGGLGEATLTEVAQRLIDT